MIEWEARRGLSLETARAELAGMTQLSNMTSHLISCRDSETALDLILDSAIELQGADFGTLQVYTPKERMFEIARHRGFNEDFVAAFHRVSADVDCLCGRVLRAKSPMVVPDVELDPEFEPYLPLLRDAGYRAVQSIPMLSGGQLLGVLSTHLREPGLPSPVSMHVTSLFARQSAETIARLKAEEAIMCVEKIAARELSHRLKNLLTMIQAIARQTLSGSSELKDFGRRFEARLSALSRAHDVVVEGPSRAASIYAVLREQLLVSGDSQVRFDGPDVQVPADAAYPLALVLHELYVNAQKHGALSTATGRISVSWHLDPAENLLYLDWVERGGPAVHPHSTKGFGSALMRSLNRTGMLATESLFQAAGVACTLRVSLN
jgi:two-component sensor histidine kinase